MKIVDGEQVCEITAERLSRIREMLNMGLASVPQLVQLDPVYI